MIDSLLKELFGSIVKVSIDKWKDNEQFRVFRLIAHEKVYRELRWNIECLSSSKSKDRSVYLKALKTDVFTELAGLGAPIDEIFTIRVSPVTAPSSKPASRVLKMLAEDDSLSRLLDRTYNRIGILHLRINEGLSLGDVSYVRSLIMLSLDGIEHGRNELRKNRL